MSLDCENASPSTTAGKCVGPLQQANRYQLMSVMNPGTMPNTSSPRAERPAALADMPTPIFRRPLLVPSSTGVNYGYGFSTNVENIGRGQVGQGTSLCWQASIELLNVQGTGMLHRQLLA